MKKPSRSNRPRIRSWEADPDVMQLLDLAVATTGASLKEIVNEALRTHGPIIIRRLLAEREEARQELEKLLETFPSAPNATVKANNRSDSLHQRSK